MFDGNGNLISDADKEYNSIQYRYMNLRPSNFRGLSKEFVHTNVLYLNKFKNLLPKRKNLYKFAPNKTDWHNELQYFLLLVWLSWPSHGD